MANDITITPGTGAAVATDESGGKHFQLMKLVDGTEDSTARIGGDAANGLDVDVTRLPGTVATDITAIKTAVEGGVPVTGTFYPATQTVALDAASLAALESITVGGTIELGATSLAALESITAVGPLTDTQLRATAVPVSGTFWQATQPVSGTVAVSNFPASQPVTDNGGSLTVDGTVGISGTVPVSGPLTDAQLRAAVVPVGLDATSLAALETTELGATTISALTSGGGLTDTQLRATAVPVSGTVTASGPLTDTQLRATAVPVSGTVTASGPLTDTQLRATAVPVSGTVTASGPLTDAQLAARLPLSVAGPPNLTTSGTITTSSSTVALALTGQSSVAMQATGTFTGISGTIEGSIDGGTTWFQMGVIRQAAASGSPVYTGSDVNTAGSTFTLTTGHGYYVSVAGLTNVRYRSTAYSSGTATISIVASSGAAVGRNLPNINVYGEQLVSVSSGGLTLATVPADGVNNATGLAGWAQKAIFNESQWERERGNTNASILTSSARTTTTNGADQTLYNGLGVLLTLVVSAQPGGAETLSLKIQGKDNLGNYFDLADGGVQFTAATGTKSLLVAPGVIAADAATGVTAKALRVPRIWRPVVTHSASGSWTYTLAAAVLT